MNEYRWVLTLINFWWIERSFHVRIVSSVLFLNLININQFCDIFDVATTKFHFLVTKSWLMNQWQNYAKFLTCFASHKRPSAYEFPHQKICWEQTKLVLRSVMHGFQRIYKGVHGTNFLKHLLKVWFYLRGIWVTPMPFASVITR